MNMLRVMVGRFAQTCSGLRLFPAAPGTSSEIWPVHYLR